LPPLDRGRNNCGIRDKASSNRAGGSLAMSTYLVLIDQADHFEPVAHALAQRRADEPGSVFHLIVPAAATRRGAETDGSEHAAAVARLAAVLAAVEREGVTDATGEVGDGDLLVAVESGIRTRAVDGIIVASPRERAAHALSLDLADRLGRAFGLPVTDIVDPSAHALAGHNLGVGVSELDRGARPQPEASAAQSRFVRLRWITAAGVVIVIVAATALITVALRPTTHSPRPAALSVTVGGPEDHGATQELTGYYPAAIEVHPGDDVVFHNGTIDVPHTVTFGLTTDRSNQPRFGGGSPKPVIVAPCESTHPLSVATSRCTGQSPGLPPFDGQEYYSSGIIAPGKSFVLHVSPNIAAGSYAYGCLIHPAQRGSLIVVPPEVAIQSESQLLDAASFELNRDRTAMGALLNTRVVPPAGATVQAGTTTGEVSFNQFFPQAVTIKVGQTVTWVDPTPTPHVVMVDGGLDPAIATFAKPSPPSGSDYTSGFADSGPIGAPPYPSRTYQLRFTKPGTYTVICSLHPGMTGTITVTP
jgi:plastocyanin